TAAEVVDRRDPRLGMEGLDEGAYVKGVQVVADLLPAVAVDAVPPLLPDRPGEVGEEAVHLRAGMPRAGQASTSQADGGHAEIAPVFLDHGVRGELRSAEEAVEGRIHTAVFADAVVVLRPGVVPACRELDEGKLVRHVAVDLVRAEEDEGGLRTRAAGGPRAGSGGGGGHPQRWQRG